MTKKISYREYKRRAFNALLTECFVKLHAMVNGLDENCSKMEACGKTEACGSKNESKCEGQGDINLYKADMARKMAKAFFVDEMCLDKCTMKETKDKLCDSTTFVKDCVKLCESIADEKAEEACEQKLELTDDDEAEVSDSDKSEIEKLFAEKTPTVTADAVAKASVEAMLDERKKSDEIKDAIDLAKAAGESKALEETVMRLERRGPTSLMNAITTFVSESAIRDVDNNLPKNGRLSVATVLRENAEEIRERSMMMYSLFETMNAFGFKKYTEREIRDISLNIYNGK